MVTLFIVIVFGLGVAYFATQNTNAVSLNVANYFIEKVPLYVIVIVSILFGIFVSWLVSIANSIASVLRIHGKETELREAHHTIDSLKQDNNKLLIENAHLKGEREETVAYEEGGGSVQNREVTHPSFVHRIKQSFT